jgi:hypothetical protein
MSTTPHTSVKLNGRRSQVGHAQKNEAEYPRLATVETKAGPVHTRANVAHRRCSRCSSARRCRVGRRGSHQRRSSRGQLSRHNDELWSTGACRQQTHRRIRFGLRQRRFRARSRAVESLEVIQDGLHIRVQGDASAVKGASSIESQLPWSQ